MTNSPRSFRAREAGAGHLVLVGVILLAIIGTLGVVGYNAFKRSQLASVANPSKEEILERAKAKMDSGDVYGLTKSEKSALKKDGVTVDKPAAPSALPSGTSVLPNVIGAVKPSPDITDSFASASLKNTSVYSTNSLDLPAYREVAAVDGSVWFTNANTPFIGKMSSNGDVTKYKSGVQGAYFTPIVKGSDGRLWFAGNSQKIHAVTVDGKESTYAIPSNPTLVESMVLGPDGNVWFTTWNNNQQGLIGKVTPSGNITEYKFKYSGYARGLTVGADKKIWFGSTMGLGTISTDGEVNLIGGYQGVTLVPWGIASDGKGNVWGIGHDGSTGSKLVRIDATGKTQVFDTAATKNLFRLYSGPDGTVWFSDWGGGAFGRVASDGTVTKFAAPDGLENALGITFIGRDVWVSYAGPLKNGAMAAAGKLVKFTF